MKAFPTEHPIAGMMDLKADGMDLRDYFAAKAMQGLLTHQWLYLYDKAETMSLESAENYVVETSYFVADLMMKAREK